MRRRAGLCAIGALAICALAPATAFAHGLVSRSDLPIPQWLFAWAAVLVLVLSFVGLAVLWPKPKLEDRSARRLFGVPAWVGARLCSSRGRRLRARRLQRPCGQPDVDGEPGTDVRVRALLGRAGAAQRVAG